jgi:hypothetical protein
MNTERNDEEFLKKRRKSLEVISHRRAIAEYEDEKDNLSTVHPENTTELTMKIG